jgi:hypothetical protein
LTGLPPLTTEQEDVATIIANERIVSALNVDFFAHPYVLRLAFETGRALNQRIGVLRLPSTEHQRLGSTLVDNALQANHQFPLKLAAREHLNRRDHNKERFKMNSNIVIVKSLREDIGIVDFFKRLEEIDIGREFGYARLDASSIRDILREYISEHGISSLFRFSLACDAVLHGGIHVDEIESVILSFIQRLNGTKHLLIVDPYFYSDDPTCLSLFERIMSELSSRLEKVTIITNGRNTHLSSVMHGVLRNVVTSVKIQDVVTDEFHDRFWIDLDSNQGVVMGTSLNGIGKKIALVDYLESGDVKAIVALAKPLM